MVIVLKPPTRWWWCWWWWWLLLLLLLLSYTMIYYYHHDDDDDILIAWLLLEWSLYQRGFSEPIELKGKYLHLDPPPGAIWRWRTWFPKSIVLKEIRWDCHDVGGGESDDKDDDDHNTTDSDLTMNIYITMRITIRTTIRTTMIVVYYNHYQRTALLWQ